MKLCFEVDLGEIEIETNTETGRIDSVWVSGGDVSNLTVEEFILAVLGGQEKWSRMISEETYKKLHDAIM